MKIEVTNKRVVAVVDNRQAEYPKVIVVVDEGGGGDYDNFLAFEFNKDLDKRADIRVGQEVDISGYLGSREGKGRYYTSIRGTYCKVISGSKPARRPAPNTDDDVAF